MNEFGNGKLLSKVIEQINDTLYLNLDWLEKAYPLAQAGRVATNEGEFTYPFVYHNDGSEKQFQVVPDGKKKSFLFWEVNSPYTFTPFDEVNNYGDINFEVAVPVWLNLPLIDKTLKYDFTDDLIEQFIYEGLFKSPYKDDISLETLQIERQILNVFDKYDYRHTNKQFLMYPFSGFKASFTITTNIDYCK